MSKLVPKLRFKEFSGDWEEKKLIEICNINPTIDKLPNNFIYIDLESVVSGKLLIEKEMQKENAPSRAQRVLKNGDVIYQMVRPYQKNNLLCKFSSSTKYVASTGYAQLRAFDSNSFLYQLIHIDTFINKVLEQSTGSSYPAINSKSLAKITVVIPKSKEQQKIANTFTSLDNLIEAQTKKVETLKQHKKGLMQKLFPLDGEKEPKVRFDGFCGDWDKKAINEILTIGSGRDYKKLSNGNIPVYGTGGYMLSVDNYLYDGESICIGRKGTIDKPMFLTGKFWTVDTLFYTHSFRQNIPRFIYLLFQKINWYNYNEASGVPSLSKVTIGKINIFIPKPKEQQKIANTFTSLDNLIEAQTKKVETLKQHKKGLMQKLFVNKEEN